MSSHSGMRNMSDGPKKACNVFRDRKLKAWHLVERVLDVHHELQLEFGKHLSVGTIQNMGVDEMADAAFRFLTMRHDFTQNQPMNVDIGYHYTRPSNLQSIIRLGLLSPDELDHSDITPVNLTGSNCGRGIYVAADPISFASQGYGRLCIMTARGLWGICLRLEDSQTSLSALAADTILVRPNDYRQFAVLKRSVQCLPLMCFQLSLRDDDSTVGGFASIAIHRKIVFEYHKKLQAILDEVLEQGKTVLPAIAFGNV